MREKKIHKFFCSTIHTWFYGNTAGTECGIVVPWSRAKKRWDKVTCKNCLYWKGRPIGKEKRTTHKVKTYGGVSACGVRTTYLGYSTLWSGVTCKNCLRRKGTAE